MIALLAVLAPLLVLAVLLVLLLAHLDWVQKVGVKHRSWSWGGVSVRLLGLGRRGRRDFLPVIELFVDNVYFRRYLESFAVECIDRAILSNMQIVLTRDLFVGGVSVSATGEETYLPTLTRKSIVYVDVESFAKYRRKNQ